MKDDFPIVQLLLTFFPLLWLSIMLISLIVEGRFESCKLLVATLGTVDQLLIEKVWEGDS